LAGVDKTDGKWGPFIFGTRSEGCTPWSKMFLGSAYLSRGLKNRFTSGSGSEVLMGHAEGKSMLYLETRCIAIVRGSGTQGIQNGDIDCTPISASLPGGQLSVMAENLVAMLWDQSITHKRARAEPLVVILQHIEAEHVVKDKLSTELELMFSHLENDEQ